MTLETTTKRKMNARKKKGLSFNGDRFKEILEENENKVIDQVYAEAVYLALKAKHWRSSGLISQTPITKEAIAEMNKAMLPLVTILRLQATMSFARVFNNIMKEPQCRAYFLKRSAGLLGKTGGRPSGNRAPYLDWLERAMKTIEYVNRDAIPSLTAKEHFEELRHRPEIDGELDDGSLSFRLEALEKMGYKDDGVKVPVITQSAVTETLTLIRKAL